MGLNKGIYTLLMELDTSKELEIGALGKCTFPAGIYAYTGSARGRAGFSRVRRHLDVAAGTNRTRRWHIDYLLPHTTALGVVLSHTHLDLECKISRAMGPVTIPGFGSSDCKCQGHLHMEKVLDRLHTAVMNAHERVSRTYPVYMTIKR